LSLRSAFQFQLALIFFEKSTESIGCIEQAHPLLVVKCHREAAQPIDTEPPFSPTLNSKLPCFFEPVCFSSSAIRAINSSLLCSGIGIHSGEIFRATLGFYLIFLEPFFLLSAHRFFIMSDNRFLPAGVRRSRFFLLPAARLGTALLFAVDFGD
jgi:hypothetical protein